MFVVAIHATDPADGSRAPALAAALGVTAYDARPRVMSPGPCVVAVTEDGAHADEIAAAVRAAGFPTVVRDTAGLDRPERIFEVRTFALEAEGWRVATRAGRDAALPYGELTALVAGMSVVVHTSTETITTKKRSLGRAVMTGGMSVSKKVKHRVVHTEQERERFLHVYTRSGGVAVVRETGVDYAGLAELRQATRAANFDVLVRELRERTPDAPYDDRLLTIAGQRQLLGPRVDAEAHTDIASALLASCLLL